MTNDAISGLVYETAMRLDAEDFKGFMRACGDVFSYSIRVHSPDLGREMVWLEQDRKGMQDLLTMLPQHVRMKGRFRRHVSVYKVERPSAERACAHSSVLVVFTDQLGSSRLFLAGQYEDVFDTTGEAPRLIERVVRLDSRDVGPGMHIPV
jgi:methanesulfonate monooxygenase small subunit